MMFLAKITFFISVLAIIYVYFGYPLLLVAIGLIRNQKINKKDIVPFVTIIIPAFNEEKTIAANLENKLKLDYPGSKLEIIVVSDSSTDNTDNIVMNYQKHGVKLLRQEPRAGKTRALNLAVSKASGEIIVFSDANSIYASDALGKLTRNFFTNEVGYVTGKMVYTYSNRSTTTEGCSAYMKYENFIRALETRTGSIVGVDGGIDAVRKELYKPMNKDQLPDFILPLKVIEQGYRVVFEQYAILKEEALGKSMDEYNMRVRVTLRALWAIFDMRQLLSIKRFGFFAVQLWSHKLLRYACFLFLVAAYISNLWLWPIGSIYRIFFSIQCMFYLGALCALIIEKIEYNSMLLRYFNYFVLINFASAHAFVKFLLRKKQVLWTPRKG